MKKVLVAVAMLLGLGSSVAFAQVANNSTTVETEQTAQAPKDEYTKIEVKELPEAVTQALAKSYEGASIKEAYVAEKEETKIYKVILTGTDGKEITAVLNEKGEEVKA